VDKLREKARGFMGSIYKRGKVYWIKYYSNGADLQLAAQKQAIYLKTQAGTITGTVHDLNEKAVN
jgi:hypothetical protein